MTSLRALGVWSLTLGAACAARPPEVPTTATPRPAVSAAASEERRAPSRVEALLARMTLEEKVGQLVQRPGGRSKAPNSKIDDAERAIIRQGGVGSYLNVAGAEPSRALQELAVKESRLGIPLLFAMDVVHGYRTIFPVPLGTAASWDPELVAATARAAAREASAVGLHWTFAPMVDIARDPRWGRVVEGAGEDPYLGAVMAAAAVRGFQGTSLRDPESIVACAKHFAGYGAAQGGRDYDSADLPRRALEEIYFPPFNAAVRAGAGTIMSAFNDIAGLPPAAHPWLMRETLRDRWGFTGVVVSDWNAVAELIAHGVAADRAEAGALALNSGVDVDMSSGIYAEQLVELVRAGRVEERRLDLAVTRVLALKEALGLFDEPFARGSAEQEAKALLSDEHRAIARKAAARSLVLLKNESETLPLKAELRRLAVIGPLADDPLTPLGSWKAQGRAEDTVTVLAGLRAALEPKTRIAHERGCTLEGGAAEIDAAVRAARAAEAVVLVIGESWDMSGEARSRANLELPGAQEELARRVLAVGKPTAVVLMTGRPLPLPWLAEQAPALVQAFFPGTEAGNGIADVLLGRGAPTGRLPITVPRSLGQIPIYYAHRSTGRPADPDLKRDTTRYHDLPIEPLFAFGHGLAYTSFEYSELQVLPGPDRFTVRCRVTNTGKRAGEEVVELYVRDPVARVARPVRELRGFARAKLGPGRSARVAFDVPFDLLAYPDAEGQIVIDAGDVSVEIGRSAADIRLQASARVTPGARSPRPLGTMLSEAQIAYEPAPACTGPEPCDPLEEAPASKPPSSVPCGKGGVAARRFVDCPYETFFTEGCCHPSFEAACRSLGCTKCLLLKSDPPQVRCAAP